MYDPAPELELLSSVDSSIEQLSPFSDRQNAVANSEKFVAFFMNGGLFCISAGNVAAVVPMLPISPLPNAPDLISGIAGLNGGVIAVLNMSKILGLNETHDEITAKLIVLRCEEHAARFAFPVAAMHGLISVSIGEIDPVPASSAELVREINHSDGVFSLIDSKRLLKQIASNF